MAEANEQRPSLGGLIADLVAAMADQQHQGGSHEEPDLEKSDVVRIIREIDKHYGDLPIRELASVQ